MIKEGSKVTIDYTVSVNGEVIETTPEHKAMEYVQGENKILYAVQRKLEGKVVGETVQFELQPEDAYGLEKEDLYEEIPMSEMPDAKLEIGMMLHEKQEDGRVKVGRVAEIRSDTVLMNFNHPMAGKRLFYEIKIKKIV